MENQEALQVIYASLDELNEQLPPHERLAKSASTPLLKEGHGLDSLSFVNLVALVEEKCADRFGKCVVLADKAESFPGGDPFATVGTLAQYLDFCLQPETRSAGR